MLYPYTYIYIYIYIYCVFVCVCACARALACIPVCNAILISAFYNYRSQYIILLVNILEENPIYGHCLQTDCCNFTLHKKETKDFPGCRVIPHTFLVSKTGFNSAVISTSRPQTFIWFRWIFYKICFILYHCQCCMILRLCFSYLCFIILIVCILFIWKTINEFKLEICNYSNSLNFFGDSICTCCVDK